MPEPTQQSTEREPLGIPCLDEPATADACMREYEAAAEQRANGER